MLCSTFQATREDERQTASVTLKRQTRRLKMNDLKRSLSPVHSRREFLRFAAGFGATAGLMAACSAPSREPRMTWVYPTEGTRVPDRDVPLQVAVRNFSLLRAGAPRPNEGHLHFFIDVPADSIADGQLIPTDQADKYVHAGAPPFNTRTVALTPGVHTVTAVMGDGAHNKLAVPAPVSVTFIVS
jgi:hypothetical protein